MASFPRKTDIAIMLALVFSISAHAEEAGKPLAEKLQDETIVITASVHGCDEDIKEHCSRLGENAPKIFMCLAAYEEHLNPECRQGILEAALSVKIGAEALDYSISACETDVDTHCREVRPGEGRIVNCIKANESKVSKECISALQETGLWELGK